MTQRVTLSNELHRAVHQLAADQGVTVDELLLEALALEHAVTRARRTGGRILVERGGHVWGLVRSDD